MILLKSTVDDLADDFEAKALTAVSARNPRVVNVVRYLVEVEKKSSAQVIERLKLPITKASLISFCHRAGIKMNKQGFVPAEGRSNGYKTGKRARAPKKTVPFPDHPEVAAIERPPMGKIMKRRLMEPRCCWAGCVAPPMTLSKPFCSVHNRGRDAMFGESRSVEE